MEAILTKIGLPLLISIFGEALSRSDHAVIKGAGDALKKADAVISRGDVSSEDLREINRHSEVLAQQKSAAYRTHIEQVNQSLRAEIASNDPYVRRMRPTFGYLMALTWAAQMLALAWVILEDPKNAPLVMQGFESLGLIWTVGLSVLGIYVYKRSEDKKILAQPPATNAYDNMPLPHKRIDWVPPPVAVRGRV